MAGYEDAYLIGKNGFTFLAIESAEDLPPRWNPDHPHETTFTSLQKIRTVADQIITLNVIKTAIIHPEGFLVAYRGISIQAFETVFSRAG